MNGGPLDPMRFVLKITNLSCEIACRCTWSSRFAHWVHNRKDKTMKRIRNNDLTHYFFRDHSELPESYLKHCREFFQSLGIKTKANELQADKLQATSSKRQADAETNKK
jgi:hypothetical protein